MSSNSSDDTPTTTVVLGKHSGRKAFRDKLKVLGRELNDDQLNAAFRRFKDYADIRKIVFDPEVRALAEPPLGKHSGLAALRERLNNLDHRLSDKELYGVFHQFRALAKGRNEVPLHEIVALVEPSNDERPRPGGGGRTNPQIPMGPSG